MRESPFMRLLILLVTAISFVLLTIVLSLATHAQEPPTIQTSWDTIPNPCAGGKVTKEWNGGSWQAQNFSPQGLPTITDRVFLAAGYTGTLDYPQMEAHTLCIRGTASFPTQQDLTVKLVNLFVPDGGELTVGTAAQPIDPNRKVTIVFADIPLETNEDPSQYLHGLVALGKVTMHGAPLPDTFVRLAAAPNAGDTTLQLSQAVQGWQGHEVVVPGSSAGAQAVGETEVRTVTAVSPDGKTLTLASPLTNTHPGSFDGQFLPHVGSLTRNVLVRSENPAGTRGHTLFTNRATVDIRYAAFEDLGRTTIDPLDSTTYDSNGAVTHLGTNQIGRYALHMHHLHGPTAPPSTGHQFTLLGNVSRRGEGSPRREKWGMTIHDSHYGRIQGNITYHSEGWGIGTEDGNESFNVFERNFAVRTTGTGASNNDNSPTGGGHIGSGGNGFWFRGVNNKVGNNVAAASDPYGYNLYPGFRDGLTYLVPPSPGADLSQYVTIDANSTPIRRFEANEAYGIPRIGLRIWGLGSAANKTSPTIGESVVKDFRVWNAGNFGSYSYPSKNVTFDGFIGRGTNKPGPNATGIFFSDYLTHNGIVRNADIQGMAAGIVAPYLVGNTKDTGNTVIPFTVKDSYLRNNFNIRIGTMWGVIGGQFLAPRDVILRNVTYDPGGTAIEVRYANRANGNQTDVIVGDRVFVFDHNGVSGDDFRVYYNAQHADFIVPQTGSAPPGSSGTYIGSPEAGLTNQQNWDKYNPDGTLKTDPTAPGLAIAGAITPCTTTRPGIVGFVCPSSGTPAPPPTASPPSSPSPTPTPPPPSPSPSPPPSPSPDTQGPLITLTQNGNPVSIIACITGQSCTATITASDNSGVASLTCSNLSSGMICSGGTPPTPTPAPSPTPTPTPNSGTGLALQFGTSPADPGFTQVAKTGEDPSGNFSFGGAGGLTFKEDSVEGKQFGLQAPLQNALYELKTVFKSDQTGLAISMRAEGKTCGKNIPPATQAGEERTATCTFLNVDGVANINIFSSPNATGPIALASLTLNRISTEPLPNTISITGLQGQKVGNTVSGVMKVFLKVSANTPPTVEFDLDGNPLGSQHKAPYTFNWNTTLASNGPHTLTAKLIVAGDSVASDSVSVTVNNP